jgi:hypothetical protein
MQHQPHMFDKVSRWYIKKKKKEERVSFVYVVKDDYFKEF